MSRSVKFISNNILRRVAGWMASFLAVASVSLLGRSGEAAASPIASLNRGSDTLKVGHSDSDIQMSYLQVGMSKNDSQDWWPPTPE